MGSTQPAFLLSRRSRTHASRVMIQSAHDGVVQWREAISAPAPLAEAWTRHCPACQEWLQKPLSVDRWVCRCGWQCP